MLKVILPLNDMDKLLDCYNTESCISEFRSSHTKCLGRYCGRVTNAQGFVTDETCQVDNYTIRSNSRHVLADIAQITTYVLNATNLRQPILFSILSLYSLFH